MTDKLEVVWPSGLELAEIVMLPNFYHSDVVASINHMRAACIDAAHPVIDRANAKIERLTRERDEAQVRLADRCLDIEDLLRAVDALKTENAQLKRLVTSYEISPLQEGYARKGGRNEPRPHDERPAAPAPFRDTAAHHDAIHRGTQGSGTSSYFDTACAQPTSASVEPAPLRGASADQRPAEREGTKPARRVVQLLADPTGFAALCDDGSIWIKPMGGQQWYKIAEIPGTEADNGQISHRRK
jgi:hypothetical protein